MDIVADAAKKMDEKRNSKQFYAEAYNRYKTASDAFQVIIDEVIENGNGIELNRIASAIELAVESFTSK